MSTNNIEKRHAWDRWKDILFIGVAVILAGVAIGSVTSKAAGKAPEKSWSLTVIEQPNLLHDTNN